MGSEFTPLVVAMPLPAEFLLETAKELLDVGTYAVDLQHLLWGELHSVRAKVEITPAEHFDQEAQFVELPLFDPEG